MFCLHNEIDLRPEIVSIGGSDWVVVLCKACENHVGASVRLIELVDKAIKRAREETPELDEPDWEDD